MSEHTEQVALMEWSEIAQGRYPELALLFAVPNGGLRSKAVAGKMKAEGLKAGVPDLFLPVPRTGYYGMFVEMKVGRNKPTERQIWWLEQLDKQGYLCIVAYGFDEAKDYLSTYLDGEWPTTTW